MINILLIFYFIIVLGLGFWVVWNILETAYIVVMLILGVIAYVTVSIWDFITTVLAVLLVKPIKLLWMVR